MTARAEYERALGENKALQKRYFVQHQLRQIDERAMRFVQQLLANRYTGSATDAKELEDLLAASQAHDARKHRVRALSTKPAGP